jgi:hypothetical protein
MSRAKETLPLALDSSSLPKLFLTQNVRVSCSNDLPYSKVTPKYFIFKKIVNRLKFIQYSHCEK